MKICWLLWGGSDSQKKAKKLTPNITRNYIWICFAISKQNRYLTGKIPQNHTGFIIRRKFPSSGRLCRFRINQGLTTLEECSSTSRRYINDVQEVSLSSLSHALGLPDPETTASGHRNRTWHYASEANRRTNRGTKTPGGAWEPRANSAKTVRHQPKDFPLPRS